MFFSLTSPHLLEFVNISRLSSQLGGPLLNLNSLLCPMLLVAFYNFHVINDSSLPLRPDDVPLRQRADLFRSARQTRQR